MRGYTTPAILTVTLPKYVLTILTLYCFVQMALEAPKLIDQTEYPACEGCGVTDFVMLPPLLLLLLLLLALASSTLACLSAAPVGGYCTLLCTALLCTVLLCSARHIDSTPSHKPILLYPILPPILS